MTGEKKKREINKKERVNELSRTLTHKLNVSRIKLSPPFSLTFHRFINYIYRKINALIPINFFLLNKSQAVRAAIEFILFPRINFSD